MSAPLTLPRAPGRVARLGGRTVLWQRRSVIVSLLMVALLLALVAGELLTGRLGLTVPDVLRTLAGHGTAAHEYAVYDLRLPRALTAVLVGLALGASGAAFQSLTRNPLGSPDVIGFTTGSATGALLGVMVLGGSQLVVAGCSVAGGIGTAALVYGLARQDGVQGYRLVLLGIGASTTLMSVNAWLITRADLDDALAAQVWLTGTLNARGWEHVVPMLVVVLVCLPLLMSLGRALDLWDLGTDTAGSLGLRLERTRLAVVVLGVVLVAAATTATGPVAFVALTAPHVVRLLTRSTRPGLLPSALAGGCLLLASDVLAQRITSATLPVGVVTSLLGGGYLVVLLTREWRTGRG